MCNCHGHCDTLWCVVCITSVCLGNEKGCPLPALWLASKCGLRRCGEREKYRVCGNVRGFFFLIFLFKTLRKFRILNNTQDQMKQLSQKKNYFNSERLPLHFRTGIWGTCVLPTAGILSSHQIFLQETSSLEELRAAKWESVALPCHGKSCLLLGEMGVNELAHPLKHFGNISSQNILIFNAIRVRNILSFWLSVKYVAKIFWFFNCFFSPLKIQQFCRRRNRLSFIGDTIFCQETSSS